MSQKKFESFTYASRKEISVDALDCYEGKIPADIYGHVFINSPVGTVNSPTPIPEKFSNGSNNSEYGQPIFNGDGMVLRFDLAKGKVAVKTGLLKTPCYYADEATKYDTLYHKKRMYFKGRGIARTSIKLGSRNQINTSLTAFKFNKSENTRITANFDAGRPFEINPETLQIKTAVGKNSEWLDEFKGVFQQVFPLSQSTAHPSFDPETGEYFTVNFTKSLSNLIFKIVDIKNWFGPKNTVKLLRWDGKGKLKRWRIVDKKGKNIIIYQTMHQTNYSKNYIILVDSSLKFSLNIMFNEISRKWKWLNNLIRWITSGTNLPQTPLYIIKRADLKDDEDSVRARKVIVNLETVHYSIDYEDENDQITIHTAHNTASCAAEWIRPYDTLRALEGRNVLKNTIGLITTGEMDIGRIGKFIIDGTTGNIPSVSIVYSKGFTGKKNPEKEAIKSHTWAVGLNTYRNMNSADENVKKIRYNFWQSYGLDPRMLTNFIFDLYSNYKNRIIPTKELLRYTRNGIPFCLFRQDTTSMKIDEDFWIFEMNENLRSLQFIPRERKNDEKTDIDEQLDGYIFCTMINGDKNILKTEDKYSREIWIFDAANLKDGPVCKLGHKDLQFAFTIHSVWTPDCKNHNTEYKIDVKEDYEWVIEKIKNKAKRNKMREFLKKEVYPHFD